jgi:hypothetical protein
MTIDPVKLLIEAGAISSDPFAPNSRYRGVAQAGYVRRPGERIVKYVLRRFIPQRRAMTAVFEHIVQGGERPDGLAAQTLGDAELYWRIADANAVIDPNELTDTVGARVIIPPPPGL